MTTDTFEAVTPEALATQPPAAPRSAPPVLERIGGVPLSNLAVGVALLVLLGISVWLRTRAIHLFYWVDEGISVGIASHPLSHIPALMRQDGSPPLYYLLLHVWMSLRGRSEVATHELSLVFALLTVPAAYWAGSSLFDRRTGLVAAVLGAGAPYITSYAQETRMYSLVALLSVVVAASFLHSFVFRRRRYLPVFALSLVAALYSHNWALFLTLMCGVAFLWCLHAQPGDRRGLCRDGLLAFGAVGLLYLPWLPTLLYQSRHTGAPWDLPPVVWSLTQGAYFLVGGRGVAMLLLLGGGAGLLALRAPVTGVAGGSDAGQGAARRLSPASWMAWWRRRPGAVSWLQLSAECLLILGLGTMLLAFAYSKLTPAWAYRYLAVVVGPLLLLFALGVARAGRLGMVALALTACFWLVDPVAQNLNAKSNVASVAAHIRAKLGSDALVLSTQPEQVPVLSYYLPAVRHWATPLGPVTDPHVVDWGNALARLRRSSVHAVLAPIIEGLHPGERVALVIPVNLAKSPEWMVLIHRATARWSWFLAHDRHLRRIGSSNANWNHAGVAVQAVVYVVR